MGTRLGIRGPVRRDRAVLRDGGLGVSATDRGPDADLEFLQRPGLERARDFEPRRAGQINRARPEPDLDRVPRDWARLLEPRLPYARFVCLAAGATPFAKRFRPR